MQRRRRLILQRATERSSLATELARTGGESKGRSDIARIAYLGLPLGAILLHADGHELLYVGLSRKDSPGTRRAKRLFREVHVMPDLSRATEVEAIEKAAPDLLVSWFWTKKIPRSVLAVPALGGFGVHPSLLPRHRGPDPYYWAIRAGDAETGVTAHVLREEYDTGEVLDRRALSIEPEWSAWTLAKKLDRPSLALLRAMVFRIAREGALTGEPQDERLATPAPEPSEEDLVIRWNEPTVNVLRQIRAASPWPGALTWFDETPVTITRAREEAKYPRVLAPGEAAVVEGHTIVRTADGSVALLEGRDEAEQSMDAAAFRALVERGHEAIVPPTR